MSATPEKPRHEGEWVKVPTKLARWLLGRCRQQEWFVQAEMLNCAILAASPAPAALGTPEGEGPRKTDALAKDRWPDLRVSEIEAMKADAEKASRYLSLLQKFAHRTGALAGDDVIEHFHRWCDGHDRQMPAPLGTPEGEWFVTDGLAKGCGNIIANHTNPMKRICLAIDIEKSAAEFIVATHNNTPASQARTIAALRHPFRNADDDDWTRLDQILGYSAHGKFWRAVMAEVRSALKEHPNG